jgi:hypothetical protein
VKNHLHVDYGRQEHVRFAGLLLRRRRDSPAPLASLGDWSVALREKFRLRGHSHHSLTNIHPQAPPSTTSLSTTRSRSVIIGKRACIPSCQHPSRYCPLPSIANNLFGSCHPLINTILNFPSWLTSMTLLLAMKVCSSPIVPSYVSPLTRLSQTTVAMNVATDPPHHAEIERIATAAGLPMAAIDREHHQPHPSLIL